jgi:hypothetical protein
MQKAASYASTEPLPLCQFLDRTSMFLPYAIGLTAALQFTAAILYDQECTGSVRDLKEPCPGNAEEAEKRCSISQVSSIWDHNMQQEIIVPLFEHMLLIDYGIDSELDAGFICDKWPPWRREFDDLCDALMEWTQRFPFKYCFNFSLCIDTLNYGPGITRTGGFAFSDLALMLYYYNTHRKPVNAVEYESGKTGYFGILQELISEVPLRGSDRLQRKLSVDIHKLIPKTVKDPDKQRRMISIATSIAAQHNLPVHAPAVKIPEPRFEAEYSGGRRLTGLAGWFKALFKALLTCPFSPLNRQDREQKLSMKNELPPIKQ